MPGRRAGQGNCIGSETAKPDKGRKRADLGRDCRLLLAVGVV